jgi:hypothetical protein
MKVAYDYGALEKRTDGFIKRNKSDKGLLSSSSSGKIQ